MKPKNKDILHDLFAGIPDEVLPFGFNEKAMLKIQKEAEIREKRHRYLEIFGYVSGIVVMLAVCVFVLHSMGISFELPKIEIELHTWSFPKPDFNIFRSQSFVLSVYVGVLALFLLIIDSIIRRHIEKTRHK
ncbi:MAG: hypothetical protein LBV74_02310 [Tannerella sp.]|jgi:H+/Cl- antiporter ClcA|nr:hypothetical protein [Tannerella sp.]